MLPVREMTENWTNSSAILTRAGELRTEKFLSRCSGLLRDNYVLWCSAFSAELIDYITTLQGKTIALAPAGDAVRDVVKRLVAEGRSAPPVLGADLETDVAFPARVMPYEDAQVLGTDEIIVVSHKASDEVERLLFDAGVGQSKVTNFMRDFSSTLMLQFEHYAMETSARMEADLKHINQTKPEKYREEKIDAYIFFWMMECYTRMSAKGADSVDRVIGLAKLASGQGHYEDARNAVDRLIPLNDAVNTAILRRVSFILTYRCNLRCQHCWIYERESFEGHRMDQLMSQTELTASEIDRLVRASSLLGGATVTFTGGEIFMRKDLGEILYSFADSGVEFEFFTNATFPKRLEELLEDRKVRAGIKLIDMSLDGDRDTHDAIRGDGVFDKLVKCIEVARSHGVRVKLKTVIMKQNLSKLDSIARLARKLGCDHEYSLEMRGHRYVQLPDIRTARPYLFANTYFRIVDEEKYKGAGCLAGITRCNIIPSGLVEACTISKLFGHFVLGTLHDFDHDFDSLWVSRHARDVRERIRNCPGCPNHCERG